MRSNTEEPTKTTARSSDSSPRSEILSPEAKPSCDWRDIDPELYEKIELEFRVWSFHVYYKRSFKEVRDHEMRFVKAFMASRRPIRDRQAVVDWYYNGVPKEEDEEETEECE